MNQNKPSRPEGAIDWPVFAQKIVSVIWYILRWLNWGVRWLVTLPLATLVLAGLLLAWQGGATPGQALVKYTESVSTSSTRGIWLYPRCAPQAKSATTVSCPLVKTDAAGYAAYIDHSLLSLLRGFWLTFAVLYTGFALATRRIPSRGTNNGGLSVRYGRPVNDNEGHKDGPTP